MNDEIDIGSVKEKDDLTIMVEFVREKSKEYKLSNAEDFLEEPLESDVEKIMALIKDLEETDEFEDIKTFKGEHSVYLYSEKYITSDYADMMFMVAEENLLKLVASTVRKDAKAYPRPTKVKLFTYSPFKLTMEQIEEILRQMGNLDEY